MSHWTYPLIKQKLARLSEEEGFLLREVSNEFRSHRCSRCGWVRKSNRKGKTFRCTLCSYEQDSDLNAASNLEIELFELPFWVRLRRLNLRGFFWGPEGFICSEPESIVPVAKEMSSSTGTVFDRQTNCGRSPLVSMRTLTSTPLDLEKLGEEEYAKLRHHQEASLD